MRLADFSTTEFLNDPYPQYKKLRAEGPLVPIGPGVVLTGHYYIVDALLHDPRMGKDYLAGIRMRYGDDVLKMPLFRGLSRMAPLVNPPAHTRLRALMMKAFDARQIDTMREAVQRVAHDLVDEFEADGTADLVAQFAVRLPIVIICRMLDVPVEDALKLNDAVAHVAKSFDAAPLTEADLELASASYVRLEQYFAEVLDARHKRKGADLISLLLRVEESGEMLTPDEILSNVILLFLAGHETTSNMLGNALIALHRHPQQLALLKSDPSRMPKAVLECLRYEGSVQSTARSVLDDIEIAGFELPRGTMVFLCLASANRDPAKFTHPDRFDIDRDEGRIATFGAGVHRCLGIRLALIELEIALSVLFERLPGLSLPHLEHLKWRQRGNVRSVESLTGVW
jgi:cytochrome P450